LLKPEVVPFRLTQNIVDAFGPTGADGIYSENLKVAMSTLRRNRDTLLSVLEPFAKDPIIKWKRTRNQQRGITSGDHDDTIPATQDRETKEAIRSMNVIDERLLGIYNLRNPNFRKIKRTDTASFDQEQIVGDEELNQVLPLSVEGQVHKLIAEATSNENLVQLYIGWMPWI
jgi:serine/threonine-protein kinase ATR